MDPRMRMLVSEVVRELAPVVKDYAMLELHNGITDRKIALERKMIVEQRESLNTLDGPQLTPVQPAKAVAVQSAIPVDPKKADGRATWSILHTRADYFPENPTPEDQEKMKMFVTMTVGNMVCSVCATHGLAYIESHPVDTSSRAALKLWTCDFHNAVNSALGKQLHECSAV